MNRIVWLPIEYSIRHRPYRHRNESSRGVREDIAFDLPAVDDATAAIEIVPPPPTPKSEHAKLLDHMRGGNDPYLPSFAHTLYTASGRLLRQVVFGDGVPVSEASIAAYLAKGDLARGTHFFDYPLNGYSRHNVLFTPLRQAVEPDLHEIRGDNRDNIIQQAREKVAGSLALMGDILMKDAIEPVLALHPYFPHTINGRTEYGVVLRVVPHGFEAADKDAAIFRADEFDLAYEIASDLAALKDALPVVEGEITVHDPAPLQFDPWHTAVERMSKDLSSMRYVGFSDASTDAVRAWCDAEDAMKTYSARGGDDREPVISAISRFVELYTGTGTRQKNRTLQTHLARFKTLPQRDMNLEDEDVLDSDFAPALA